MATRKTSKKRSTTKTKSRSKVASRTIKAAAKKTSSASARKTTKSPAKSTRKNTAKTNSKKQTTASVASQYFQEPFANSTAQAENVMQFSSNAMKQLFSNGYSEMQRKQGDVFSIGKQTAEQFTNNAETATQSMEEAVANGRDNIEASLEYGNIAADISKAFINELFQYANNSFSDNMEISQEAFNCRTVSDVLDLQNKLLRTNIDNFFTESMQLSETMFRFVSEASEPLNNRMVDIAKRFGTAQAA